MNKNLHRVVFSASRRMRIAVQETAKSAGKAPGATSGTASGTSASSAFSAALAAALFMSPALAQVVANPTSPGTLRPIVLVAPNGVPTVNITPPSAAGVSRNQYADFNVAAAGLILNNSRVSVQSQIGGWIAGNQNLATGSARIILNEVIGGNASRIRGALEVAGPRTEVIVANPSGIAVSGGSFINISNLTLTTGLPQVNAFGGLDSYVVRGGSVTVDGAGLDASRTDSAAILARAVNIGGGIWAPDLKVVSGANQISADHSQVTPVAGAGPTPTYAVDVSQLGGMYSNHIWLVGTEHGLGVRNAGAIQAHGSNAPAGLAGIGQFVITAAGRLENTGTIQSTADTSITAASLANAGNITSATSLKVATAGDLANNLNGVGGTLEGPRVELSSSAGNVDNRNGGAIRQTSTAALSLSAPTLSNTAGGWIGAEPVPVATTSTGTSTGTGTSTTAATGTGSTSTGAGTTTSGTTSTASTSTTTAAAAVPVAPGSITASGAIWNDNGGKVYAGGPVTLQTANLANNGGALSVASMTLSQPGFQNAGGTLNVSGAFNATLGTFDNSG
ncbi:filamentous hemagglutinin N-terminal domain-containing protein, partial [Variovorax humicola]